MLICALVQYNFSFLSPMSSCAQLLKPFASSKAKKSFIYIRTTTSARSHSIKPEFELFISSMYKSSPSVPRGIFASNKAAPQILRAFHGSVQEASYGLRSAFVVVHRQWATPSRAFSTAPSNRMKEFFPEPETKNIRVTEAAWPHPIYTQKQLENVIVAHREVRNRSDRFALAMVRLLRWGLDRASGYRHGKANELLKTDPAEWARRYGMTEKKYMIRNVFLESVAGVPGMVAGMLRHLHSMRRMKRDHGWIETLLEESYNERMHLLTFLKMAEPGPFMRLMVLGAQGVFFNAMFFAYLVSPRTAHRFVGYLEEEAVLTYTREIEDIDAGKLPMWANMTAPDIAVKYWNMPEGHRTMRDLLLYIRADEAKHREVNHTFGNLDQKNDPNPYVSKYINPELPHPTKGIEYLKPTGWEREEVI